METFLLTLHVPIILTMIALLISGEGAICLFSIIYSDSSWAGVTVWRTSTG